MHPDMTSTTFSIDGFRIVQTLGVVRGISVRSRSVFGTIGAKFETLFGGNISLLLTLCEKTRSESFAIMIGVAERMGANGVVGIRYDATEIMVGVTEVLCYGTAVVIEQE
ncbi:MAG: YbjQ family protein [Gemmatimonadota bacterium]